MLPVCIECDSLIIASLTPASLQVLVGPEESDDFQGPWYFTLNNRRLWVLKQCREEGLLDNNQIGVRTRQPKSAAEAARYTVAKCALNATMMREATTPSSTRSLDASELQDAEVISEKGDRGDANEAVYVESSLPEEAGSGDDRSMGSRSITDDPNVQEAVECVESNRFSMIH